MTTAVVRERGEVGVGRLPGGIIASLASSAMPAMEPITPLASNGIMISLPLGALAISFRAST